MRERESSEAGGLGWIDIGAILCVVAVLAFTLGQVVRGRAGSIAEDAARLAEQTHTNIVEEGRVAFNRGDSGRKPASPSR